MPLSAQLLCGPVIVVLQPQFATYSLLANMLVAPLVAPVTILGTAAVPLVPLLPWLATALIGMAGLFAAGVAGIARFMAGLPGAAPPWPEGPFGLLTMVLFSVLTALAVWAAAILPEPSVWCWRPTSGRPVCLTGSWKESPCGPAAPRRTGRGLVQPLRRGRLRVCNPNPGRNQQWPLPSRNDPRTSATNSATWRDVTPAGIVLITGPEEYLGIRAMDRVRSQVRAATPDVEVTRLNAGAYEAGSLAMNVSPSLFGESKLIEVDGLESMNDAFLADGLKYLARPEQDAVLVLRHGGGVRGKKLLDAVKAGGWPVVDCQPLKKDAEKTAFVAAEFKAASRRIEPDAVQSLVNAVGANLSELAAACSQLIADAATTVDAEMVERYYGGRIEATAFKVADAAMAGDG